MSTNKSSKTNRKKEPGKRTVDNLQLIENGLRCTKMTKLEDSEKSIPVSVENGKEEVFEESNAGDGTRREDQYLHGYRLALCVVALLLSLFIMSISQTIILIILTEVGNLSLIHI